MVDLYNAGKLWQEIGREYELTPSILDRWISRINKTDLTKEKDNRIDAENESLWKESARLQLDKVPWDLASLHHFVVKFLFYRHHLPASFDEL